MHGTSACWRYLARRMANLPAAQVPYSLYGLPGFCAMFYSCRLALSQPGGAWRRIALREGHQSSASERLKPPRSWVASLEISMSGAGMIMSIHLTATTWMCTQRRSRGRCVPTDFYLSQRHSTALCTHSLSEFPPHARVPGDGSWRSPTRGNFIRQHPLSVARAHASLASSRY